MAKISTYPLEGNPKLSDKLIGTSVGLNQIGNLENPTYNFSLQQLLDLFSPLLPGNTLQGVLDNNNAATQDINLNGTIYTDGLEVSGIANIFSAYIYDSIYIEASLFDRNNSQGTAGQILTSTGSGVEWFTPVNTTPTLQQVLTSGNEADVDMILTANLTAELITANDILVQDSFELSGTFLDSNGLTGTSGQMLVSLGTGVEWQDVPLYTASSPLFINPATKNITIQQANGTQNGYLSFADWINFDGKQNALSGTGIVVSSGGTISYITNNSLNWNRAYNDSIISAAVTGTTTKTLTLTQRDGDVITTTWTEGGGGGGISSIGLTMPAAFTVTNSPLTSNGVIAVTAAGDSSQYIKGDGTLGTLPSTSTFVPYTGATQDVNLGAYDIYVSKLWLYDGPNDNYGSVHFTDGNFHIEDADGHPLFVVEDGFLQIHKSATIQSNLYTTNLTAIRDHYLPNASGTIALTSDIHAPVTIGTANGLSLIGQQLSLGLSSSSTNGALSSTDWTTFNSKFTLPALTSGSVLFSNGTTIAQDNANFFWDDTNNRLGLGIATPLVRLHILGTNEPLRIASNTGNLWTSFIANSVNVGFIGNGAGLVPGLGQEFVFRAQDQIVLAIQTVEAMRINTALNVLIGESTGTSKLNVKGPGYQLYLESTDSLVGINSSLGGEMLAYNGNDWSAFNGYINFDPTISRFLFNQVIFSNIGGGLIIGAALLPNQLPYSSNVGETLIGVFDSNSGAYETGIYAKRNIYCENTVNATLLSIVAPNSSIDLVAKIGIGDRFFIAKISVTYCWAADTYTYKITSTNTTSFDDSSSVNINFNFEKVGSEFFVKLQNNSGIDIYANINANIL
jgi:hypothetical protein